jgi:hypothetical protein
MKRAVLKLTAAGAGFVATVRAGRKGTGRVLGRTTLTEGGTFWADQVFHLAQNVAAEQGWTVLVEESNLVEVSLRCVVAPTPEGVVCHPNGEF